MAAQGGDILYAERSAIPGKITIDDIKEYIASQGIETPHARVLLSGQASVNVTGTVVALSGFDINRITGAAINGNQIDLPTGTYKVTIEWSLETTTVQRANVGLRFLRNGAIYSQRHGSNYIRRASGHNESGDSFTDIIPIQSGGSISFETIQQGAAGTVQLIGPSSRILIEKIR